MFDKEEFAEKISVEEAKVESFIQFVSDKVEQVEDPREYTKNTKVNQYRELIEQTEFSEEQLHKILEIYCEETQSTERQGVEDMYYNLRNIDYESLGETQKRLIEESPFESRNQPEFRHPQTLYESFERLIDGRHMMWLNPQEGSSRGKGKVELTRKGIMAKAILSTVD